MDIENIVESNMIKLFGKLNEFDSGMVDQITGNPMKDYLIQREKAIDNAVKEISSDIKKKLKLVASGEVEYDDIDGGYTEVGDVWLGNLGGAYHGKNINVWIEEIL